MMQFPEIRGMMEPMRSMMDDFFRTPFFSSPFFNWTSAMPAVDIEETDDAYIVTAEVPGFNKDEIEVELHDNVLMIRGKRERREGGRFLRRERAWSSAQFQRVLQLPGDVDPHGVKADFSKGELVITLPKKERTQGFRIPLN